MATILSRKPNSKDSEKVLIESILTIARDKNERVLLKDDNEWKDAKLKEIARLASLLNKKLRCERRRSTYERDSKGNI